MTSRDFCFWLQGYFEIADPVESEYYVDTDHLRVIQNHLKLVFKHEIDPSIGGNQQELQDIHDAGKYDGLPIGIQPYNPNTIMRC